MFAFNLKRTQRDNLKLTNNFVHDISGESDLSPMVDIYMHVKALDQISIYKMNMSKKPQRICMCVIEDKMALPIEYNMM